MNHQNGFTNKTSLRLILLGVFIYSCIGFINAQGTGTVLIVGIDTELGGNSSSRTHGSVATWCNIINTGLLSNVTNGKSDILVIGGGKGNSNDVKDFWNSVSNCLGRGITYKHRKYFWNSTADISSVNFNNFALIVVATDHSDVDGYLREKELKALNARKNDMAAFLCNGGALFASSCEYSDPYGYVSKFGTVSTTSQGYNDITPTIAGSLIGITNTNLDTGPWHIIFTSFPAYLQPLALTNAQSIAAIGGKGVSNAVPEFSLSKANYCIYDDIIADPSGSIGAVNYFWSIQESDVNWNRYGTEVSQSFTGFPSIMNLTSFAQSKGFTFKCNTFYRIKLAISGLCVDWKETTQLIKIICPIVNAGSDICVKCTSTGSTTILGAGNSVLQSYIWTPSTGLNNATSASPIHQIGSVPYPITYTVTATDSKGCKNTDQISIFCQKPTLNLKDTLFCCGSTLYSNAQNYNSITWSTGETDVSQIVVHDAGTYTVTVSNPCGLVTQSITVPNTNVLTGFFNPIAYNSKFYPPSGGSGLKDKLYIMDVISGNGAANIPNSYNATDYVLEIFDRWGNLFKSMQGRSCNGFNNWAINWDGTDQFGLLVQQDVYTWKLQMKNCQYKEWTCPKERRFVDLTCVSCGGLPGPGCKWYNHCKKWNVPPGTTEDVTICIGSVTVIR